MSRYGNPVVDRINDNCKLLYSGYQEKVEYTLPVACHKADCRHYGKTTHPREDCLCPVTNEQRVRNVNRPGYIDQLHRFGENKDTDRQPKAERGAPRVKVAGRPPGDLGGFFALDELTCDILSTIDKALDEVGRDRTWASSPIHQVLAGLATQVSYFADTRPDVAREIDIKVKGWVDSCRSTLKISTSEGIFDSVTCGNCGGALASPWGNRGETDVRCIGSPSEEPCGETYPVTEWLRLYEESRRNS